MIATLVDVGGSLAIAAKGMHSTGLTTDISVSYVDVAKADDILLMKSECLKIGKTLAFTTVDLYNKKDNRLIAQGRHTKFLRIAHKDPLNEFKLVKNERTSSGGEG
ncbi:5997_t:CDS:2, partial [Acaulospora colombiana]